MHYTKSLALVHILCLRFSKHSVRVYRGLLVMLNHLLKLVTWKVRVQLWHLREERVQECVTNGERCIVGYYVILCNIGSLVARPVFIVAKHMVKGLPTTVR